jgi:hypothetical protein
MENGQRRWALRFGPAVHDFAPETSDKPARETVNGYGAAAIDDIGHPSST